MTQTQEQTPTTSNSNPATPPQTMTWNDLAPKTATLQNTLQKDDDQINIVALEAESRLKFYKDLTQCFLKGENNNINHRKTLLSWFAAVTLLQLLTINIVIVIALFFEQSKMNSIFSFNKFFIGATFAELLSGLIIIVKFVFNKDVFSLLNSISEKIWNKQNDDNSD